MMDQPLTSFDSFLLLLAGLVIIWVLATIGNRRIELQKQADLAGLLKPSVYYEYLCTRGHYLGREKPPEGQLCEKCVDHGYIKGICNEGGQPHDAHPISVDEMKCDSHGVVIVDRRSVGGEPVGRVQMLANLQPRPIEIPLPVDDPLPKELIEQERDWASLSGFLSEIQNTDSEPKNDLARLSRELEEIALSLRKFQNEVEKRLRYLDQDLPRRLQEVEHAISERSGHATLWQLAVVLAFVALLVLSPIVLTLPLDLNSTVGNFAVDFAAAILSFFELAAVIVGASVVIFMLVSAIGWRKRGRFKPDWNDARLSFIVGEVLSLLILPIVLGLTVTITGVLVGLGLDILAELIILAFRKVEGLNQLVGQASLIRQKLAEVRTCLKDWRQTMTVLFGPVGATELLSSQPL